MEKATSLKEIAYQLGISITAVSRALRDCDDISAKTKKLVIETAINLGYMPNNINQFVKKNNSSKLIAVITGEGFNLYYLLLARKLSTYINQSNNISTTINCHKEIVDVNIVKQCISQRVDGIISLIPFSDESIEVCRLNSLPIVCIGSVIMKDKLDSVYFDVKAGTNMVANYLVNVHNTKNITYVGLDHTNPEDDNRFENFAESISKINKDIKVKRVANDYKKIIRELINSNGNLCIFCFNDQLAYELMSELNDSINNIRRVFPHFHLVGFDALSQHIKGLVDITSVDYDYDDTVEKAYELLLSKFSKTAIPTRYIVIPVKLHTRRII